MKIIRRCSHAALVCFICLVAQACTSISDDIYQQYIKPDSNYNPQKILVIGINNDQEAVKQFESLLVSQLSLAGIEAYSSNALLTDDTLTRAKAIELVKHTGSDGVIVTRLLATDKTTLTSKKKKEIVLSHPEQQTFENAIIKNYKHTVTETTIDTQATVFLSSELYTTDKSEDNLAWSIQFFVKDKRSQQDVLENATLLITEKLKNDKLL